MHYRELSYIESPRQLTKTKQWCYLRQLLLKRYRGCFRCGSSKAIQLDHIKSLSKNPALAFSFWNIQILCSACNKEKGIEDQDYRPLEFKKHMKEMFGSNSKLSAYSNAYKKRLRVLERKDKSRLVMEAEKTRSEFKNKNPKSILVKKIQRNVDGIR